jgi:hypothetical protein
MQDTINLLRPMQKGSHMNILEQYYVQKYQYINNVYQSKTLDSTTLYLK